VAGRGGGFSAAPRTRGRVALTGALVGPGGAALGVVVMLAMALELATAIGAAVVSESVMALGVGPDVVGALEVRAAVGTPSRTAARP
jgi:hypothetical protein